jgi:predicted amidohydrolase YtcJ
MRTRTFATITIAVLTVYLWVPAAARSAPVEVVLLGGKIITVDGKATVCEALAIGGGRVVAVGSDAEVKKLIGPATQVIHLEGRTVIPGIIQTHCHAIGVARGSLEQTYVELTSIAQVQEWIRRRAKEVPAGQWIQVPRADITRLEERRHPTPAELDAACTTHPVAFKAARKWVLNSLGLKVSNIVATASKEGSRIRVIRDKGGRPLLLSGADSLLRPLLRSAKPGVPDSRDDRLLAALAKLLKRYNSVGITSIFERASNREGFDVYQALRKRGQLPVRVTVTMRSGMRNASDVQRFVKQLDLKPGEGDEWVKAGPLKITVDGGIHWGNTYLREPYGERRAKFYVLEDPAYRGDLYYSVDQMVDVFSEGHRLGWQMCCHVTGDAGVDRVLDALEVADRQVGVKGRRFTLVHAYFPRRDAIARAKRLGVCVDTQADLYYKDSEAIAEVYGEDWASRFIGVGDWLRGGIPVAINGDHMMGFDPNTAMNSFNPFLHLYVAVSRKNKQGHIYGTHQKVSRMEALRAMTVTAAYLSFDEKKTGSLEVGKLADLAILDRDYLTCPEEKIRQIKVLGTLVGGKVVHGEGAYSGLQRKE